MAEILCAIDPAQVCNCASKDFAKNMFEYVVKALQDRYGMTEQEAIDEYRKGDKTRRALTVLDDIANNCSFSPIAKIAAKVVAL